MGISPDIQFGRSPGIGVIQPGGHWSEQPISRRMADITALALKVFLFIGVVSAAIVLGHLSFLGFPIYAIPLAMALTGIGFIGKQLYEISQTREIPTKRHRANAYAPELGTWSTNSVRFTESGMDSISRKQKLIRSAEKSIELSGSYCGGKVFDKTLSIIEEKLKKNKELYVRIITNDSLLTESNREKIKQLAMQFPEKFFCLITTKHLQFLPSLRTVENHTKMLIIDGNTCMTGGTGVQDMLCSEEPDYNPNASLAEKALAGGARDMDVIVKGQMSKTMQLEFYQLLFKWIKMTKPKEQFGLFNGCIPDSDLYIPSEREDQDFEDAKATLITSSSEHGSKNPCKLAVLHLIQEAKESVFIGNMTINEPKIVEALKAALARGVRVHLITNLSHKNSPISTLFLSPPNEYYTNQLIELGAKVYCYSQEKTLYHKKVMVVDRLYTAIGSFNMSLHCSTTQDEDIVIVRSGNASSYATESLLDDRARSEEVAHSTKDSTLKQLSLFIKVKACLILTGHIFQ